MDLIIVIIYCIIEDTIKILILQLYEQYEHDLIFFLKIKKFQSSNFLFAFA